MLLADYQNLVKRLIEMKETSKLAAEHEALEYRINDVLVKIRSLKNA